MGNYCSEDKEPSPVRHNERKMKKKKNFAKRKGTNFDQTRTPETS